MILTLISTALLVGAALLWFRTRQIGQGADELLAAAAKKLEDSENLDKRSTEHLEAADALCQAAGKEAKEWEARYYRVFSHLERMGKQRDAAMKLYENAVVGMGKAQDMMLAEIGRLSRIAQKPVNPVFSTMVEGFHAEHDKDKAAAAIEEASGPLPPPLDPVP